MPSHWECETCAGRLIMATCQGRTIMLDHTRDNQGTYAAWQTAAGAWIARKLSQGDQPQPAEHRYSTHYDQSPQCRPPADGQRAASTLVSSFLADYRKAGSAHARDKRNQRGRRKPPSITGYRIPPP